MAGRTLRQQYEIAVPPARVFRALSEPVELTRWMLQSATLTLRPGTSYWFTWPGGYTHKGKVLSAVQGRSLVISWPQGSARKSLGETRVKFSIRRKGKGTLLQLTHSGFGRSPAWVETYARTSSGWAYYLSNLRSVLESQRDHRRDADEF